MRLLRETFVRCATSSPNVRAYGTGIRAMPIGRHLFWSVTHYRHSLLEELLCGIHVSLFARAANPPDCHQKQSPDRNNTIFPGRVPIGAHRCTRISLLDHVARVRNRSAIKGAKRASQSRTVSWVKTKPRSRKHLSDVTETQFIAQTPQDDK